MPTVKGDIYDLYRSGGEVELVGGGWGGVWGLLLFSLALLTQNFLFDCFFIILKLAHSWGQFTR
jgi:hypothetical protein